MIWAAVLMLAGTLGMVTGRDCTNTSVGLVPINDLASGYYEGEMGGLYPNGSNERPADHTADGLALLDQIVPRSTGGDPDDSGLIVFASVGMSNARYVWKEFMRLTLELPNLNPSLRLFPGATGSGLGGVLEEMTHWDDPYWQDPVIGFVPRLEARGYSPEQVQVIWVNVAYDELPDGDFAEFRDQMAEDLAYVLVAARRNLPNLALAYLNCRVYSGYTDNWNRTEPESYWTGWAVKRAIEEQIGGHSRYRYEIMPWLSWGWYPWADGTVGRQDGTAWYCPEDYQDDGFHLVQAAPGYGAMKAADRLLEVFLTDPVAVPWFLAPEREARLDEVP